MWLKLQKYAIEQTQMFQDMQSFVPYGVKVIDSQDEELQDKILGNAAAVSNGKLTGIHVTSDPTPVYQALESGADISKTREMGKYGDLGAGLYFSIVPQLWMGRATSKYNFLKDLTEDQKRRLVDAILNHDNLKEEHINPYSGEKFRYSYVTKSERETAYRWANDFLQTGNEGYLVALADQPYNIPFWKEEFLKPLGIKQEKTPLQIPIEVQGKFADLTNFSYGDYGEPDDEMFKIYEDLKQAGFDGAFVRGGFTSYPQAVVWNVNAVVKFGDWER